MNRAISECVGVIIYKVAAMQGKPQRISVYIARLTWFLDRRQEVFVGLDWGSLGMIK